MHRARFPRVAEGSVVVCVRGRAPALNKSALLHDRRWRGCTCMRWIMSAWPRNKDSERGQSMETCIPPVPRDPARGAPRAGSPAAPTCPCRCHCHCQPEPAAGSEHAPAPRPAAAIHMGTVPVRAIGGRALMHMLGPTPTGTVGISQTCKF